MANRIELNENDIENVVGGAFIFYTHKQTGEQLCYVEGIGVYKPTSDKSKRNISIMCAREENNGKSQQELLDMAIAAGYLNPNPIN